MSAFTNFLEKLGSDFLKSTMVPSLALLIACILLFDPIFNMVAAFTEPQTTNQLMSFAVMFVIFTVILGLTLTALNTLILNMFEGYAIFPPIKFLYEQSGNRHRREASRQASLRDQLKERIFQLQEHTANNPDLEVELDELKDEYYEVAANYSLNYPDNPKDILPTRLGNIIKAAEDYPADRYGFEGTHFWSRLIHVIPTDYKAAIDNVRNELSFHVNMSFVSIIFSFLCVLSILYAAWLTAAEGPASADLPGFLQEHAKYLVAAAAGALSGSFFYNASIMSANSLSKTIRSASDLFHLDLLKKFGLQRPKDSIESFSAWQNLNELIVLGSHSLTFQKLDYRDEETVSTNSSKRRTTKKRTTGKRAPTKSRSNMKRPVP